MLVNRSVLAGLEGHPFHPLLVPLPIGAFVSSLIFGILTRTWTGALVAADPESWTCGRSREAHPPWPRAYLTLNATPAVLFAIGYALPAGDHVALDMTRWASPR
jgi:uncharacterized membrane protein